jgi:endonuclease YncB( thermonuclease family)
VHDCDGGRLPAATVSAGKAVAQASLFARYGVPQQIRPDAVDEDGTAVVRVYAVGTQEAAHAFVDAETRGPWGNPARAELRESVGWCVIVDLRAYVAAAKIAHPVPRIRG